MTNSPPTPGLPNLRQREVETARMVAAIESKMARLAAARVDRIRALEKTRSAIARAIMAGQCAPARHESQK